MDAKDWIEITLIAALVVWLGWLSWRQYAAERARTHRLEVWAAKAYLAQVRAENVHARREEEQLAALRRARPWTAGEDE